MERDKRDRRTFLKGLLALPLPVLAASCVFKIDKAGGRVERIAKNFEFSTSVTDERIRGSSSAFGPSTTNQAITIYYSNSQPETSKDTIKFSGEVYKVRWIEVSGKIPSTYWELVEDSLFKNGLEINIVGKNMTIEVSRK